MFKTCRKWRTESFGRVMTGRKSLCVPVLGVMRNWGRHADLTFIIYILTSTSTCTIYNCDNHIIYIIIYNIYILYTVVHIIVAADKTLSAISTCSCLVL